MKLLLIEDDTALHTALSRSLTRLGWEVEVCMDGRAALPRWRAGHPDVVLLDLTLPGRDGLAVLQQARDEGLTTPVLILTARGTVGDKVHTCPNRSTWTNWRPVCGHCCAATLKFMKNQALAHVNQAYLTMTMRARLFTMQARCWT